MSEIDEQLRRIHDGTARMRLNPVLPEARVAAFEQASAGTLPEGYRRFITEIGNGGAGWEPFNPDCREDLTRPFRATPGWGNRDGFLTLREHGCGLCDLLILTGEDRGNVWFCDGVGRLYPYPLPEEIFGGVGPSLNDQPAMERFYAAEERLAYVGRSTRSFLDHVEGWLRDS